MKTKVAIIGYGNIGRAVEQALLSAADMELVGIYHHQDDLSLIQADVAVLCTPTREVPKFASQLLSQGISTVDSFDIHSQIYGFRQQIMSVAQQNKSVSIIAAGWDPGSDSMIRALLMAMSPQGITYTNFGPGRSMGHTVAVKAIKGVKDALSMTIPLGTGIHRRMVYVELNEGEDFERIKQDILQDDYFVHDETHVQQVVSVQALNNVAHGVNLVRYGVSGNTHNQHFEFNMMINNPALTGQVLVASARAAARMCAEARYGAYTLIEIPPIYFLYGNEEELIKALV